MFCITGGLCTSDPLRESLKEGESKNTLLVFELVEHVPLVNCEDWDSVHDEDGVDVRTFAFQLSVSADNCTLEKNVAAGVASEDNVAAV